MNAIAILAMFAPLGGSRYCANILRILRTLVFKVSSARTYSILLLKHKQLFTFRSSIVLCAYLLLLIQLQPALLLVLLRNSLVRWC